MNESTPVIREITIYFSRFVNMVYNKLTFREIFNVNSSNVKRVGKEVFREP